MKIQILGPGCSNCKLLAKKTEKVAQELGLDYELAKVEDLEGILSLGVMATPALVVDGQVKVAGRVPSAAELESLLSS